MEDKSLKARINNMETRIGNLQRQLDKANNDLEYETWLHQIRDMKRLLQRLKIKAREEK